MIIPPVDQRYADGCSGQGPRRREPTETSSHDNNTKGCAHGTSSPAGIFPTAGRLTLTWIHSCLPDHPRSLRRREKFHQCPCSVERVSVPVNGCGEGSGFLDIARQRPK